jgi:hypothetical protein
MTTVRIPAADLTGAIGAIAKVGLMNATARGDLALGIRSEHLAEACRLPPLAARSTVAGLA